MGALRTPSTSFHAWRMLNAATVSIRDLVRQQRQGSVKSARRSREIESGLPEGSLDKAERRTSRDSVEAVHILTHQAIIAERERVDASNDGAEFGSGEYHAANRAKVFAKSEDTAARRLPNPEAAARAKAWRAKQG